MASKKSSKGKRYSDQEKQQIVDFVNEYNSAKGRGGVANAAKKFGASQITIGSWLKKGGKSAAGKAAKRGRPAGKVAASGGKRAKLLADLAKIDGDIAAKRRELAALEAKFEKLKAGL